MILEKVFAAQARRRGVSLALVVLLTGLFGAFAARVRPDHSVEHFFPVWNDSREVYERYRADFPHESSDALVIVSGQRLLSRAGLAVLGQLEDELSGLPHVIEVEGPRSARDIRSGDNGVDIGELFPDEPLGDAELNARFRLATTDPLFRWNLFTPGGDAVSIRLTVEPQAADDPVLRQEFYAAARNIVDRFQGTFDHRFVLTGLPAIRAQYVTMMNGDLALLVPLALLVVLGLLVAFYRSAGVAIAALVTILVALVWSQGVMGMLGYPMTVLSTVAPIVVIIISLSDTVHIVSEFVERLRAGEGDREALAKAMAHSALPCLYTELVLAGGFCSLIAINITAIVQFGISCAFAMVLTWLANMLVLPLALSVLGRRLRRRGVPAPSAPMRWLGGLIEWIAEQVVRRPHVVITVGAMVLVAGAVGATRIDKISYSFDDLRRDSPLFEDIEFAESVRGGLTPLAIYFEGPPQGEENAILEPAVLRATDRAAAFLESFPEIQNAVSLAEFLRKAHAGFVGDDEGLLGDGLPGTRPLIAQEIELLSADDMLRDVLSHDRRSTAVVAYVQDAGSERIREMLVEIDSWLAAEARDLPPGYGAAATGQIRLFDEVNRSLTDGLLGSLGGAVLTTILLFGIVLRSGRLALAGLIPNVSPMLLVFGFMGAIGIALRPSTVVVFSIVLVIADDDTMQYLARLRAFYRRAAERPDGPTRDLHREAAIDCMRATGLPMFVTACAVSLGFLLLTLASSRAVADIGLLIGVTLFVAVFADLFLNPIFVSVLKPKLGPAPRDES